MSCQQVPRLTEDPYVFTEANSSVTVYNPQIHKLTPVISSSPTITTQAQKQFLTQKSQLSLPQHNRTNQKSQSHQIFQQQQQQHQQQQQLLARINGSIPQIVNGMQKNVTNIQNTGGFQKQFQLQCQQQHTPRLVKNSTANRKLSLSSSSSSQMSLVSSDVTLHQQQSQQQQLQQQLLLQQQSHSLYSTTKHNTTGNILPIVSTTVASNIPPLYQKGALISPQSSNILPQIDISNLSQRNHSNLNKQFQNISTSHRTLLQHQFAGMPPSSAQATIYQQQSPLITSNSTVSNVIKKSQQNKSHTNIQNDFKLHTDGNTKQKKLMDSDKDVFLAPSKKDSKVLSSLSTRKTLKNQTTISQNSQRAKRSYSQSSHHEALQRISSIISSSSSSSSSSANEWHAPDSYIFDNVLPFSSYFNLDNCDDYDIAPCVQYHWLDVSDIIKFIPTSTSKITREQRIELRKAQLRRQAIQNILAQKFRSNLNAKKRFICVSKALRKFKDRDETPPPKKCCFPACSNNALALTAYCYLHITRNTDQYLFLPCTAKFSDNSQCRVPVFDITHELPLCREHAWKRDNYNRILQEQKPKKSSRKRPRSISSSRPQKRKQKRRKTTSSSSSISTMNNTTISNNFPFESSTTIATTISHTSHKTSNYNNHNNHHHNNHHHHHNNHHNQLKSNSDINYTSSQTILSSASSNQVPVITQDMLTVCENSSAYESSEDTGVGGLSESELMVGAHDVIEEIPLGDTRLLEEHDLTNVLNQLPVDAFNELFTTVQQNGPLEPTQEEQEDLERALEAVNKQVKSLQQMTGGDSAFLGDFLDVDDQILDDTDICTEVVLNSPDTSGIDTSNILIDGCSNSNSGGGSIVGGGGSGNENGTGGRSCISATASDIRELVQT